VAGAVLLGIGLSLDGPVATAAAPRSVAETDPTLAAAPAPAAAPSPTPVARYTPSSAVHLTIPSVGLDLPVLPLTPRDDVIDPPLLTAAYWIEPYGAPAGPADPVTNTLYLAAHSAGSGDDGFDPLLTRDQRDTTLEAGDRIEVATPQGTVTYAVERAERIPKNALPTAEDVWEVTPGRLVLITCFQRSGRPASENLVVFADAVR
jgi:sortase (surface protein transpeptidase)